MANDTPLLAVLIDADNTSYKHARAIFDEIASFGEASVRRIYGDFSSSHMKGWSGVQAEFGIVPHHQPANTVGKNASDIALVIDAMDLMHSGRFDGFVLVSSDSDFTRLASRIREQGLDVYGIGQQKTPDAFRKACKRFIFVENILGEADKDQKSPDASQGRRQAADAGGARPDPPGDGGDRAGGRLVFAGPDRAVHHGGEPRFRHADLRQAEAVGPGGKPEDAGGEARAGQPDAGAAAGLRGVSPRVDP
jgi:uncharacterized LabA/DUF88 family protein